MIPIPLQRGRLKVWLVLRRWIYFRVVADERGILIIDMIDMVHLFYARI